MPPVTVTLAAADPGTYFLEDDGVPGNNQSQFRRPDGSIFVFEHPTDDLTFFALNPGVTLVVNATDIFVTANVTVGSLTDPAQSPDAIVVQTITLQSINTITLAATGSITESSDADGAADIIATRVAMSAGTGIGLPGNAIEMVAGQLEAETNTGGITLVNLNSVNIGGFANDINGLHVITSGDINFTAFGTIQLSDNTGGGAVVTGGTVSGNINLTALGFDSDLTSSSMPSFFANRGNIVLTAGRDISFGLVGSDLNNDVLADGSITINAGRDFLLSGDADVISDAVTASTGGGIVVNAGRNISVLDDTGTGATLAAGGTAGADVVLTTGSGGMLTLEVPGPGLLSNSGDVIVNADRIAIAAGDGIVAGTGAVTLAPATAGRPINLGIAGDTGTALQLSDAELDRISTPNLILGSNNAGPVRVAAPISPLNAANVIIRSGSNINVEANVITGASLSLSALDDIFQSSGTILTGTLTAFVDAVDDDPSVGGTAVFNGAVTVTSTAINGNSDNDSLNGTDQADMMFGLAGNDTLRGFGRADTLIGGAGDDSMSGGLGDDTFGVDSSADVVAELAGEGSDRVLATASYTLPGAAEVELLSASNQASTNPLDFTGNGFNQIIIGNAGVNNLDGGDGNDTLRGNGGNDVLVGGIGADVGIGGAGDDTYHVDSFDAVIEAAGEGSDRVFVTASYNLTSGSEVEQLTTIDQAATTAIDIVGNGANQSIFGNAGVNRLAGAGGIDVLWGLGGNDVLNGGAGGDFARGGAGDDTYAVDDIADMVIEAAGEGIDRVLVYASFALGPGQEVELLATGNQASVQPFSLTGNDLPNNIQANNGPNSVLGLGGNDVLFGLGGNDTLNGGAGVDQLTGGAGADNHVFADALGATNIDFVFGFVSGSDEIHLDNAVFTAFAPGALPAGTLRLGTSAVDANDRILYDQATGRLFYDPDATGAAAPVHFATLSGNPIIGESDFAVI